MKKLINKCIVGPVIGVVAVIAMAYVLFGCKGKDPDEHDPYY